MSETLHGETELDHTYLNNAQRARKVDLPEKRVLYVRGDVITAPEKINSTSKAGPCFAALFLLF